MAYCGIRVVEGRHRTYMSDFVRDARGGGCSVGTPPSNLGFRLVRDDDPWRELAISLGGGRDGHRQVNGLGQRTLSSQPGSFRSVWCGLLEQDNSAGLAEAGEKRSSGELAVPSLYADFLSSSDLRIALYVHQAETVGVRQGQEVRERKEFVVAMYVGDQCFNRRHDRVRKMIRLTSGTINALSVAPWITPWVVGAILANPVPARNPLSARSTASCPSTTTRFGWVPTATEKTAASAHGRNPLQGAMRFKTVHRA